MWKEEVLAYFQVLFQYFPGGNEETHEKHLQGERLSRLRFEPPPVGR
jgi:hypothetical protein